MNTALDYILYLSCLRIRIASGATWFDIHLQCLPKYSYPFSVHSPWKAYTHFRFSQPFHLVEYFFLPTSFLKRCKIPPLLKYLINLSTVYILASVTFYLHFLPSHEHINTGHETNQHYIWQVGYNFKYTLIVS